MFSISHTNTLVIASDSSLFINLKHLAGIDTETISQNLPLQIIAFH